MIKVVTNSRYKCFESNLCTVRVPIEWDNNIVEAQNCIACASTYFQKATAKSRGKIVVEMSSSSAKLEEIQRLSEKMLENTQKYCPSLSYVLSSYYTAAGVCKDTLLRTWSHVNGVTSYTEDSESE